MREQTVERILFDHEIKKRVLAKSACRCAHCGNKLNIKSMTVDHVIPLSKGGTNEEENLVALCNPCNRQKSNDVIDPSRYYKYLQDSHADTLVEQHETYCENVSWLSPKQYTKEDKMEIPYFSKNSIMREHKRRRGNYIQVACLRHTAILQKAKYNDMEEVMNYLTRFHKKFNIDNNNAYKMVSNAFSMGCLYILKRSDEIIGLFPVIITKENFAEAENEEQNFYIMKYLEIPVLYQKEEYKELIAKCIFTINSGLAIANGKNISIYEIDYSANDRFMESVVTTLKVLGTHMTLEEGDINRVVLNHHLVGCDFTNTESSDPEKDLQYFSKTAERIMNLAPANKKRPSRTNENRKKNNALAKERKRISRMALEDEYDERYYGIL